MTTHHCTTWSTLAVAAALALGAGAGPALAHPHELTYVPRAPGAVVGAAHRYNNGSSSTIALNAPPILPALTPSQSAAVQRAEQHAARGRANSLPNGARYSNAELSAYPSSTAAVRAVAPDGTFDWGDAGIGAAGGLAIGMLGVGGGLALSQRRSRRAGTSAVVTG